MSKIASPLVSASTRLAGLPSSITISLMLRRRSRPTIWNRPAQAIRPVVYWQPASHVGSPLEYVLTATLGTKTRRCLGHA